MLASWHLKVVSAMLVGMGGSRGIVLAQTNRLKVRALRSVVFWSDSDTPDLKFSINLTLEIAS